MAFPSNYSLYDEYVIQSSRVSGSGALSDFPIYVDLSDMSSTFWSTVKSDGGDIRVTLNDGATQLPVEVVAINTVAKTGEIHFKADISGAANTTVRVWYNGTEAMLAADSTYGLENVWTDYQAVYHCEEDPGGSAPQVLDSTANDNDLTVAGSNWDAGQSVAGAIAGNALRFDAADSQYARKASGLTYSDGDDLTIQAWIKADQETVATSPVQIYGGGKEVRIEFKPTGGIKNIFWWAGNADSDFDAGISDPGTAWTLCHLTVADADSGNTITPNGYMDGALDKSGTASRINYPANITDIIMGRDDPGSNEYFSGDIDEYRVRDGVLSADWIATEYNNQSNHATWAVVTAKSTGGGGVTVQLSAALGGALGTAAVLGIHRSMAVTLGASAVLGGECVVVKGLAVAFGGGVLLVAVLDSQQSAVNLFGTHSGFSDLVGDLKLNFRVSTVIGGVSGFGAVLEGGQAFGVSLSQSAEAAFPDRPSQGGMGLLVSMSEGGVGAYVEHEAVVDQEVLHVRFMMRDAGASGGSVVLFLILDETDEEFLRLTYDTDSGQIIAVLADGLVVATTLVEGLLWQCVELKIDSVSGEVALWVNGRLADTVVGGFGPVQGGRLWFGCVLKDQEVVGELFLDEWVIGDDYIGPVTIEPAVPFADDPTRWLVVYNTADADSVVWAEGYRQARSVPYANLLGLPLSTDETISFSEWVDLFNAIDAYLTENSLEDWVLGILVGYRVPGYVDFTGTGFIEAVPALLHHTNETSLFNPIAVDGVPVRPTKENLQGLRLTARIDGVDLGAAESLSSRASFLMADGLGDGSTSTLWFNPYTTPGPGTDPHISSMAGWAASLDRMRTRLPAELTVESDPPQEVFFSDLHSDGFFWGWSEANPSPGFFGAPEGSRVFCFPLYSVAATASTLRTVSPSDWAGSALAAGYASFVGSSRSYSLSAAPLPRPFFEGLRQGWTLAESWFVANPVPGEGLFLVGDPLMKVALPRGGWDLFGPVGRLEEIEPGVPSLSLRENELLAELPDAMRPSEGSRSIYLIRRLDNRGRSEAGTRVVEALGVPGGFVVPPVLPVWPDAEGWRVLIEENSVRLTVFWDRSIRNSRVELVELEGEIDGGAAQVIEAFTPRSADRWVQAIESLPAQSGRYRWRLRGGVGVEAYTPWSELIRPLQAVPVAIQIEGVHL